MAYDKFRRIPETPCGCGKCGLMFRRVMGQRGRRYAPGCPVAAAEAAERARAKNAERLAVARAKALRPSRKPPSGEGHRKVRWCGTCFGLPHRRPPEGCSGCRLPAGPELLKTASGRIIEVAPGGTWCILDE